MRLERGKGSEPKGAASEPKDAGSEPKGATSEPSGARIHWTEATRKKVHPARDPSGARGKPPKLDAAKLREGVAKLFEEHKKRRSSARKEAVEEGARRAREAEALMAAGGKGAGLDAEAWGAVVVMLGIKSPWHAGIRANEKLFVEHFVALGGAAFAVRALSATWTVRRDDYYGSPGYLVSVPEDEADSFGARVELGPFLHLRKQLNLASDADYAAAREAAEEARKEGSLSLRCALSYAFSLEAGWALADARAALKKREAPPYSMALLATLTDPELAAKLADSYADIASSYAPTMVDRMGARAAAPLEVIMGHKGYKGQTRIQAAEALALIESPEAAAALAKVAGYDDVRDVVVEYFTRAPDLARPALAAIPASDKAAAATAALILKALPKGGRRQGASGSDAASAAVTAPAAITAPVTASVSAPVAAPVAASVSAPAPAPAPAPASTAAGEGLSGLPAILLNPPWLSDAKKKKKPPVLPRFFNAKTLPRPKLAGSGEPLPLEAMERLGGLLATTPLESVPAWLGEVRSAFDPASLAGFAWELFTAWDKAGAAKKEAWALAAVGHLGDDACALNLAPLVAEWPAGGAHGRGEIGLEALARMGTTLSLRELSRIAEKTRYPAFQRRAQEKIKRVAEARGMSADALGDWLVPDLGLDKDGSRTLVVGGKSYRVGFDEHLKPFVKGEDGEKRADLPKPKGGTSAEAQREAQTVEAWHALKREVKALGPEHSRRLERAMCSRRRWDMPSFRGALADHPLLKHLTRRLVWGVYGAKGALQATFRMAEDGSFADAKDKALVVPEGAEVGIAHALELSKEVAEAWSALFGDYLIVQPFPQLGREVFRLTPAEAKGKSLARWKGRKVDYGVVLGLDSRGWRMGRPQSRAMVPHYHRELFGGHGKATLSMSPGLDAAEMGQSEDQTLGEVTVAREEEWDSLKLGSIDPVAMSELIRELTAAFGA